MMPALVSVSYVYSPEMNVVVARAYLLANGSLAFSALALSDFLGMPIVIFFFRPDMLCHILSIRLRPFDSAELEVSHQPVCDIV